MGASSGTGSCGPLLPILVSSEKEKVSYPKSQGQQGLNLVSGSGPGPCPQPGVQLLLGFSWGSKPLAFGVDFAVSSVASKEYSRPLYQKKLF